ncbi:uncharacterized protein LOC128235703 [Mya arenaria]|uniref:uncharacterized protein LOC128235703 n=1 Tax=Mya arenaria TaxID=6604 RepID=UPI0022E3CD24|nr:uncharacterized protein LOC128235703 [Mya arenaria]
MDMNRQENIQYQETSTENNENECNGKKEPTFCEPCKYDDSFEAATGYCVTCAEYLCHSCCRDQKRNKVTREHSLLKNDEIPADITPFKTIRQLSTCEYHPDIDIAYECEDHEALVCVFCLTESHRKCGNVHDLGVDDSAVSDVDVMGALQERIQALQLQKEEQRKTIEIEQQEVKTNIQSLVTKWKDHITGLGNDLETKLNEVSLSKTKQLIKDIGGCQKVETEITINKTLIETLMKYGTKRHISVVLRRTSRARFDLKEKLKTLECQHQQNIALVNVKQLEALLTMAELSLNEQDKDNNDILENTSDEVHVTLDSENKPTDKIDRSIQTILPVLINEPKQRSSKLFAERKSGQKITLFKVKTETDVSMCGIFAINLAEYGVLVADYGNRKLKLFSRKFDFICENSLPGPPVDICCDGEYAYVCYSNLKKVTKYRINTTSIWRCNEISTSYQPLSLTVFDSRLMILFANTENFDSTADDDVHIEIRTGSAIDCAIFKSDYEGLEDVKDAKRVFHFDASSIVLSENTRVSCYDVDTQAKKLTCRKWFYKSYHQNVLEKAKGVAKDSEGNIYICGEDSNNVHQVSSTNYRCNRVIVQNINSPVCVAVDDQKDRLIIGCRDDNYLHVYSFK